MATVYCAAVECEHNDRNICRAKKINLSEGRVHTAHQGFLQVWTCRQYEMSDNAKRLLEEMKRLTLEGGDAE